ncbi:MAG: hypothetical protein P8Z00_13710 [Anaerolineales bacterium]
MDPVTAAIITALSVGLSKGITKVGENLLTDGYNALKNMLQRKYGGDKKLAKAIKAVEKNPNSESNQKALEDRLARYQVERDAELMRLAEKLMSVSRQVTNINLRAGNHATQMVGDGIGSIGSMHGNVIIDKGPAAPSANDLLQHGVRLMRAGAYEEAVAPLNQSLFAIPSPDANYYLALASLHGQRPSALTYSQAKAIEKRLQAACRLDPNKAHYWYLLALLKYDFFYENGFLDEVDEINDLLATGGRCPQVRAFIIELLDHVPALGCPVYEIIGEQV